MSGGSAAGAPIPASRRSAIRVVVVGDRGTGKSSLIAAAVSANFPESVSPVLPPTHLPADHYPYDIPLTIIDTASSLEGKSKLEEELKRADVVVITYACDKLGTLVHLQSFWIPEVRRLKGKVPVIVVGCKRDLRDNHSPMSLEQVMVPVMRQYSEIEICIECSADNLLQAPKVFYYAQKAVVYPSEPLFDGESRSLKPRCMRALTRIFYLCDRDMDGALNDTELNEFQVKCFNVPLKPGDLVDVKRTVQENIPEGINDLGLSLSGFLSLQHLFITEDREDTTWIILRKFGYNDDIELCKDNIPVPSKDPDQNVELTSQAVDFLIGIFSSFDFNHDGALQYSELYELFTTAPENPWDEDPYKTSLERTEFGDLTLSGFLSMWALMTMLDPTKSLAYLIYFGYANDPATALRVTRKRTLNVKKQQSDRHVLQCFVFGPKNAGKSSLLNSFVGSRPFENSYALTTDQCYTVNAVDQLEGAKKTLILHEIQEDDVKQFLSSKESLAACDVAVFVYDSSDEYSFKRASELLMDVARRGKDTGYGVPCLLISAKNDLDSYPMAIRDSQAICHEMKIDAPICISVKERKMNNIFPRIVNAAESINRNIFSVYISNILSVILYCIYSD